MSRFVTPLAERLRIADRDRERCKRDPEFRLRRLNRARVWQGLKPRASIDEIGAVADGARNRVRDERGRFI
jgi:hypothetical protein